MSKRKIIKVKYIPAQFPLTSIVAAYLLYKQLNLTGAIAGVYITGVSFIYGVNVIAWIIQLFTVQPSEPYFKDEY